MIIYQQQTVHCGMILSKSSAFSTFNFHTASQCINALQPTHESLLLYRKRFLGNILKKNIENWSTLPNLCRMITCHGVYTVFRKKHPLTFSSFLHEWCVDLNKKAQLSLTNPRDAKACQKLLQFDVLTTLSLTILAYLHAFSCCCVRNLRNPEKFTENSNLWSSRSSKVIDLGANRKPICDLLLVINSNFSRICYRFRDIHG